MAMGLLDPELLKQCIVAVQTAAADDLSRKARSDIAALLLRALDYGRDQHRSMTSPPTDSAAPDGPTIQPEERAKKPDRALSEVDEVHIANAGLAILWPFLSSFFTRLGLLRDKAFTGDDATHRAVGLLQYLALPFEPETPPPEYELALNKVLCGMEPSELFEFGPPLSEEEIAECDALLTAAIGHAPILRDMSPIGISRHVSAAPGHPERSRRRLAASGRTAIVRLGARSLPLELHLGQAALDAGAPASRMVSNEQISPQTREIRANADDLEKELAWFAKILDTRFKLYFRHDSEHTDIFELEPPDLAKSSSQYAGFVRHYKLSFVERVTLVACLVPHIQPQLFDVFFTKNQTFDRRFTEFGGAWAEPDGDFYPHRQHYRFHYGAAPISKCGSACACSSIRNITS